MLPSEANGIYNNNTAEAVEFVQKILKQQGYSVKVNGNANEAFQHYFYADDFSMYIGNIVPGSKGVRIKSVQLRLSQLNCYEGDINGKYDNATTEAVKIFQRSAGLQESGTVDRATCDAMYASNAPVSAHPVLREFKKGAKGKIVSSLQRKLYEMGFMTSKPDGDYGDGTMTAIKRFIDYLNNDAKQAASAIDSQGTVTVDFQKMLYDSAPVFSAVKQPGDKDDEVKRIQRRLNSLYYLGTHGVDGHFGEATKKAITSFQDRNGIIPSGIADQPTQEALFSAEAKKDYTQYILRVSIWNQRVYVYKHKSDDSEDLIKTMICSTGMGGNDTETPRGVFRETGALNRWHYFDKFNCWAQYSFVIEGDILFHSVIFSSRSSSSINSSSVYNLGSQASHGCVRLSVNDAKWIYNNCRSGTIVVIE